MNRADRIGRGGDAMHLTTLETPGLGNRSYIAEADGWAVAVDVQRDLDRVERVLERRRLRLAAVVETHVHNDYVTGGLALARRHDARYVVPAGPELAFDAERAHDGEVFDVGPLTIRVIDTPGHTDAHAGYSVHMGNTPAVAAFTGGSLLLGGTGRTDLLGRDRAEALAREQYWTARRLARLLPAHARLLPTHGFGSFCLAGTAAESPGDTLSDQLRVNPAYLLDENAFVEDMLARLGPFPAYFAAMGPRNAAGPQAADLSAAPRLTLEQVTASACDGAWVVDVRSRGAFARAHVTGSVNIDAAGALATWTGWVVPAPSPLIVVAADQRQLAAAQRELVRIGFDQLAGAYVGPLDARRTRVPLATLPRVHVSDLARGLASGDVTDVIDVREESEWRQGHVAGARNIPAHQILAAVQAGDVPAGTWVYCGVGFRAAVAASLVARAGVAVTMVDDQISRPSRPALAWCAGETCEATACRPLAAGVTPAPGGERVAEA
jgi:hydroxyacylglutathione hydrolase